MSSKPTDLVAPADVEKVSADSGKPKSKKGRDSKRSWTKKKDGDKTVRDGMNLKHAIDDVEKSLSLLTIGRNRPERYVPTSLIPLVWITWLSFQFYSDQLSSKARHLKISASEVLKCVLSLAYVKMSKIHRKSTPQYGDVFIRPDWVNRAEGCVGMLPRALLAWFRNLGLFEYAGNKYVPIACHQHVSGVGLFPVESMDWDALITGLRSERAWMSKEQERSMYVRVFGFKIPKEMRLPHLGSAQVDVRSTPAYDPVSPTHSAMSDDDSQQAGPSKRAAPGTRSSSPVASKRARKPSVFDVDVHEYGNPSEWFPKDEDWLKFKAWCLNWQTAMPFDIHNVDGSACQLVYAKGDGYAPSEQRYYLSGFDLTDRQFEMGCALGYGLHIRQDPVNRPSTRFGSYDDCAIYTSSTALTLINAII